MPAPIFATKRDLEALRKEMIRVIKEAMAGKKPVAKKKSKVSKKK